MPLFWRIDSRERLFIGIGEGEVTFSDAASLLDVLAGAKAVPYRKIIDGRAAHSTMTDEELLAVCARIRGLHELGTVGALALVGAPDQYTKCARLLGALAAADRPIKLFGRVLTARRWLDEQARS